METYYTVYKITNKISGKTYIGSHKTADLDDGYMGSGKYLNYAIRKHGIENFTKEVLFVFTTPEEMYAKEAELVNEDYLAEGNTYNLKVGGFGGFDYLNDSGRNIYPNHKERAKENLALGNLFKRALYDSKVEGYNKNPKHCEHCSEKITYKQTVQHREDQGYFCSRSCSAKANNRKRYDAGWRMPEEAKKKISRSLKGQ